MAVLLTGATGFIGSRVLVRLLADGERVRVIVRPATLARPDVASALTQHRAVDVVAADLTDQAALIRAMDGVDVVFHLAWHWQRTPNGNRENAGAIEQNLDAANRLLVACTEGGVRRFVFTSSVAVYGPPAAIHRFPITEDADVIQGDYGNAPFVQYYMAPKIAIEHMIRTFSRQSGLEYVILRPSVVYGPHAPFAERFVRKTIASPRWVSPDGSPGRWQMVHVDDVAEAVALAGRTPTARNLEFNIAGAEVATEQEIKTLVWAAASAEWPGTDYLTGGARFESYEFPRYDISRAAQVLNYTPRVALKKGLEEMVAAVLAASSSSAPSAPAAGTGERTETPDRSAARPPATHHAGGFDIREFYDDRVESEFLSEYFEHSGFWNFGYRVTGSERPRQACENLMDRLLAMIGEPRGAVLDVGCGNGATTAYLTRRFAPGAITAINFSARQIGRAVQRAPGCRFMVMDATALGIGTNTFDHLICVEAAFHFETRDRFLREAARVLKPGGRLVLADAVLPPGSQTQPRANYVSGVDEYRARCLANGFSDAAVIDATAQCWAAFAADLSHYTRRKLRAGDITLRRFYEVMLWLRHLGPERYVLASCTK